MKIHPLFDKVILGMSSAYGFRSEDLDVWNDWIKAGQPVVEDGPPQLPYPPGPGWDYVWNAAIEEAAKAVVACAGGRVVSVPDKPKLSDVIGILRGERLIIQENIRALKKETK